MQWYHVDQLLASNVSWQNEPMNLHVWLSWPKMRVENDSDGMETCRRVPLCMSEREQSGSELCVFVADKHLFSISKFI